LSRLRKEFESHRAQLVVRGRVSISEVLPELLIKTPLRGVGLLDVSSVLATHGSSSSSAPLTLSRPAAPPLLTTQIRVRVSSLPSLYVP
jgi:hypothetical protein